MKLAKTHPVAQQAIRDLRAEFELATQVQAIANELEREAEESAVAAASTDVERMHRIALQLAWAAEELRQIGF